MTLATITNPFEPFVGLTGAGLNGGSLYIGVAGQDPQTNPQATYWDAAGTLPASQPIAIQGGYPMRLGTPAQLYTSATCSMRVRDSSGVQVFYIAMVTFASATLGTASAQNIGTSGATVPLLSTANTWTLAQTFTVAPSFGNAAATRTALGLGTAAVANTGTSGNAVPLLNQNVTWTGSITAQSGSAAGASNVPVQVVNNATWSAGQSTDISLQPTSAMDMRISGRTYSATQGGLTFQVYNGGTVTAIQISYDKTLTFSGYGAGTLITNSSGGVSASSDGRLKDVLRPYSRGLADLKNVGAPVIYAWKAERANIAEATARLAASEKALADTASALDDARIAAAAAELTGKGVEVATEALGAARAAHSAATQQRDDDQRLSALGDPEYAGWIAQDVERAIPEAVSTDAAGFKTLADRAILAAVVNAVLELSAEVQALKGQPV